MLYKHGAIPSFLPFLTVFFDFSYFFLVSNNINNVMPWVRSLIFRKKLVTVSVFSKTPLGRAISRIILVQIQSSTDLQGTNVKKYNSIIFEHVRFQKNMLPTFRIMTKRKYCMISYVESNRNANR